jgi:predicted nucleic acid-binding protein
VLLGSFHRTEAPDDLQKPLLQAGDHHWEMLRRALIDGQATAKLVMNAHLGALAIEHGATLAGSDRDFTGFPALRILNPLQA